MSRNTPTGLTERTITDCRHEALRRPGGRLFVRADGRTYELASQAVGKRRTGAGKIESPLMRS